LFKMERDPTVSDLGCRPSGLFHRLNVLDKHRGGHLCLAGVVVTTSLGALGVRPVTPVGVMPALMAATTALSSAVANPVVAL
jgi:hypothetical protein